MSTLAEFVRSRKKEQEGTAADATAIKEEWLRELDKLMTTIDEWLEDAIGAGLNVEKGTVEISEDRLGTYTAPKRTLRLAGRRVVVEPCARFVVGGDGRVNVDGDFGMDLLMFSRPQNNWHVVNEFARMRGEPFSKEILEEILKNHL